jgi:hypothetical protein
MTSTTAKSKQQRTMAIQKTTKLLREIGYTEQKETQKIESLMEKMERESTFLKDSPLPELPEFDARGKAVSFPVFALSCHRSMTLLYSPFCSET